MWLLSFLADAQVHVVSDGHPGADTKALEAALPATLQRIHPQAVVIFAGANDALNDKTLLPASESETHLRRMVQAARRAGASAVVLVTIHQPDLTRLMQRHPAAAYGGVAPQERLAAVDAAIARVATDEHATVAPFAERLEAVGGATPAWSTDGVHFTAQGYMLLARVVSQALPGQFAGTLLCFGDSLTYGIGVREQGAEDNRQTYPSQLDEMLQRARIRAAGKTSPSKQQ